MSGVVVDRSAVVAIFVGETGGEGLVDALESAAHRVIAAPTLVELGIVLEARYGAAGGGLVERFLRDAAVEVVAFDRDHADRALEGWRRFGKVQRRGFRCDRRRRGPSRALRRAALILISLREAGRASTLVNAQGALRPRA